mgnify:CR=1 FL=1
MFHLSEAQKKFFDTFGYLVFKGLFSKEIGEISSAFDRTILKYSSDLVDWNHRGDDADRISLTLPTKPAKQPRVTTELFQ